LIQSLYETIDDKIIRKYVEMQGEEDAGQAELEL